MAKILNYKYEIFPTKPQREQLYKILRQTRLQWNRAVTIRKKLKRALSSGQFEYVIKTCLSAGRSNTQGNRRKAIARFGSNFPELSFDQAASLYDIRNLIGNVLGEIDARCLDLAFFTEAIRSKHREELTARNKAKQEGKGKLPPLRTYWQLLRSINEYSGYSAKKFIDNSFEPSKDMALGSVRARVSGYSTSRWDTAIKPTNQQRAYGAKGEPQYKRRGESFTDQTQNTSVSDLVRERRRGRGNQVKINALHKGNEWVNAAYHRPIPEDGNIKQLTVLERCGHFFAVFSVEVPEHTWAIVPMNAGWYAGIDPGAKTALTIGLLNTKTNETRHVAIHYGPIEKNMGKLQKLSEELSCKKGPRCKRTAEEIEEALSAFSRKRSIQRLSEEDRETVIVREKCRLERTMIFQETSKRWTKKVREVKQVQYTIANQRADVLHKTSRALAEGCDLIGIGHWEPMREVSYRTKHKELKKKVQAGIPGAKEDLEELEQAKTKQGPKGVTKQRRGGRDRSIATLRSLVEEKAQRAGTVVLPDVNEAYSTQACCNCGSLSGPTGVQNLDIREWKCEDCGTNHMRDLNSAFNILKKTICEYKATAQVAASETERMATRTESQGAMAQSGSFTAPGFHATETFGRGGSLFYGHAEAVQPFLWEGEIPRSLKSLYEMGFAGALSQKSLYESDLNSPP